MVESCAATGRADPCRPSGPVRPAGRSRQCDGAGAGELLGRRAEGARRTRSASRPAGRFAQQPARRGVRAGPGVGQADDRPASFRRPDPGRHRHPQPLHRRARDRRGQDAGGDDAGVPERAAGQGRACHHGQRLPGPPRRRVDGPDLQDAGHDGRLHPDRPDRRGPSGGLHVRHHLRDRQGDGLRLPPRRAEAAQDGRGRPPQDVRAGVPRPRRAARHREARAADPLSSPWWTRPTAS